MFGHTRLERPIASFFMTESKKDKDDTVWKRSEASIRTFGGAIALALLIRIVLFEAFEIDGPSMEPSLLNGDHVVVAKFMFGLFLPFQDEAILSWGHPQPGQIVIVKSPADNVDIVKRVIGTAGDVIEVRDDVVIKNGKPLLQESLGGCAHDCAEVTGCEVVQETLDNGVKHKTSHSVFSVPSEQGPIRVPPNYIYILGDHRDRSNDSRAFGPVPINRVKGRALAIYYSRDCGVRWNRMFTLVK